MNQTTAQFKTTPQDFVVTEILPIADTLSGQGEHLWLYLKKVGINTPYLAKLLAQWAKIPVRDVGYSGLKDRNAVTYQWFSLRLPKATPTGLSDFLGQQFAFNEQVVLIKQQRHHKKLTIGTHWGNRFELRLTQVVGDTRINNTLQQLSQTGFPNYFGKQRFGHNNSNILKAYDLFSHKKHLKALKYGKPVANFDLLLSAARSHLFNAILAKRVALGTWHQAMDGDVFMLDGSQSVFDSPITQDIKQKILTGDIHPTAPLVGIGGKKATAAAQQLEQSILNQDEFAPLVQALIYLGIKQHRRALRVLPKNLSYDWQKPHQNKQQNKELQLYFDLPKGAFATALLAYLIDDLNDASLIKPR